MTERRDSKQRGRPDIMPRAETDGRVQEALRTVNTPSSIDRFVRFLREVHFKRWLGYVPPLILIDPQLPKLLWEGQEQSLLTPDNFASAMWNASFRGFDGSTGNLHALSIPFEANLAKTSQPFIHRSSSVTFMVVGDIYSETGSLEGQARRKYMLYLDHLGIPNVLPERLLNFGLRFYDREELWNKRAVRIASELDNAKEIRTIKGLVHDRVHESYKIATSVYRRGIKHPLQGGLPSLGKSSR